MTVTFYHFLTNISSCQDAIFHEFLTNICMFVINRIIVSSTMFLEDKFCNFNIVGIELAVIAVNHRIKGVF